MPVNEGWRGIASVEMMQTKVNKQMLSFTSNYNRKKFSLNTSLMARNLEDYYRTEDYTEFFQDNSYSSAVGRNDGRRQMYMANVDATIKIDQKQTLGIVVDFFAYVGQPMQHYTTKYGKNDTVTTDSIIRSLIDRDYNNSRISGNVNYRINTKNGYFKTDLDYLKSSYRNDANYVYDFLENNKTISESLTYTQKTPQIGDVWLWKGEYSHSLNKKHQLLIGIDGHFASINFKDEYNSRPPSFIEQLDINNFRYKDYGLAGYVSYNAKWSKKFSSTLEARYDYTNITGNQISTNERFSNTYWRLLPSVSLIYELSKTIKLSYDLSLRNSFPAFMLLNPFITYSTATNYYQGNPNLKPSQNLYHQLVLSLPLGFYFSIYQSVNYDTFSDITSVKQGTNIQVRTPLNYGRQNSVGATLNYSGTIIPKAWFINGSLSSNYVNYSVNNSINTISSRDGWSGSLNLGNTFIISQKARWQVRLDYQYRTKSIYLDAMYSGSMRGSVSLQKSIGDFTLSLYAYRSWSEADGKYSSIGRSITETNEFRRISNSMSEYEGFSVRVSCRFGNNKVKSQRATDNTSLYKGRIDRD